MDLDTFKLPKRTDWKHQTEQVNLIQQKNCWLYWKQDFNGCGQCADGYTRIYDSEEDLYYCEEKPPTSSPTSKPTVSGNPICNDGLEQCSSYKCADTGENPNCSDQQVYYIIFWINDVGDKNRKHKLYIYKTSLGAVHPVTVGFLWKVTIIHVFHVILRKGVWRVQIGKDVQTTHVIVDIYGIGTVYVLLDVVKHCNKFLVCSFILFVGWKCIFFLHGKYFCVVISSHVFILHFKFVIRLNHFGWYCFTQKHTPQTSRVRRTQTFQGQSIEHN